MKKKEFLEVLEKNILSFWLKLEDKENGGFYGQVTGSGELKKTANKGAILNARILWTFSAAYRVTKKKEYLDAATRAKDYILEHFIDREYGGTYWELDYLGNPVNTKKQTYAIAFMIYALSEYYRVTNEMEVLLTATTLANNIEEKCYSEEKDGYYEAFTRDWQPIKDMRLSDLDENYPFSQNTHLHLLEAYTNLYRVSQDESVAKMTASLLGTFLTYIINPETNHLDLFFNDDWSRGKNQIESYGHDIECSWLMHEAALVLGDEEVLDQVEPIVLEVAMAAEEGLNPDGSMIHEANITTGKNDTDLHWWVQAETVVGFYNIYQHFDDEESLERAEKCWQFIKDNLIDWENGEWFWSKRADGTINRDDDKAGFWKCPYHNSRMCLELIERMNEKDSSSGFLNIFRKIFRRN